MRSHDTIVCGRRRSAACPVRDDRGFTLLENVLAVVLVGLVLASAAVTFVGATTSSAALQRHQTAVRLAAQALGAARAVPVRPRADGCVPLLDGRTSAAVTSQLAAAPAGLDLSAGDPAATPGSCAAHATTLPLRGLRTGPTQTVADPVLVGGQAYRVQTFVSSCMIPRSGGVCVPGLAVGNTVATFVYRIVVTVSWSADRGCPGGCVYTVETVRDPSDDPLFETRRPTPSAPLTLVASPLDGAADVSWGTPLSPGDSPILGYSVVATPVGDATPSVTMSVGTTNSSRLTGLVDGVTYTVTVTASNARGSGLAASTTVIPYPAAVMSPSRLAWWLDGAETSTLLTDTAGTTPVTQSGQPVARWKDKSPLHNDATAASTPAAPSTVVGSGRVVPSWDGTTSCLRANASLLPHGGTPSTMFVVATAADPVPASAPFRQVVSWGLHTSGAGRQIYKFMGSAQVGGDTAYSDVAKAPLDWSRTTAQVAAVQHDPSAVVVWPAGGAGVYKPTAAQRSTGTDAAGVGCAIFPDGSAQEPWRGPIQEVVVLTGTVNPTDRRAVEEYLARKWDAPVTPRAPAGVVVTNAAPGSLAVVWSVPTWDGGSPATGYTATASPGGATCTSSGSGCVLSGLTPGTAYSVSVTATNVMGAGPASDAVGGTA